MRVFTAVRKGYESVTEKTEEVRMSPRVAKGKLKKRERSNDES